MRRGRGGKEPGDNVGKWAHPPVSRIDRRFGGHGPLNTLLFRSHLPLPGSAPPISETDGGHLLAEHELVSEKLHSGLRGGFVEGPAICCPAGVWPGGRDFGWVLPSLNALMALLHWSVSRAIGAMPSVPWRSRALVEPTPPSNLIHGSKPYHRCGFDDWLGRGHQFRHPEALRFDHLVIGLSDEGFNNGCMDP